MLFYRHLSITSIAALSLAIATSVEAKGPQGGFGGAPAHGAAAASNGIGSNTWSTPPGWEKATVNGWFKSGGTQPPGWSNSEGQRKGWDTTLTPSLPPGLSGR